MCTTENVNTSLAIKRRKTILFKVDPTLSNSSLTEEADGVLFGVSFVKDLGKYVGTFTAIKKAQVSVRKVFPTRVSGRAFRSRDRLSGRSASGSSGIQRGSASVQPLFRRARITPILFLRLETHTVQRNPGLKTSLWNACFPFGVLPPLHNFLHAGTVHIRLLGTTDSSRVPDLWVHCHRTLSLPH